MKKLCLLLGVATFIVCAKQSSASESNEMSVPLLSAEKLDIPARYLRGQLSEEFDIARQIQCPKAKQKRLNEICAVVFARGYEIHVSKKKDRQCFTYQQIRCCRPRIIAGDLKDLDSLQYPEDAPAAELK